MRAWSCLLLIAAAQPAWAGEPYYGPRKSWLEGGHGYAHEIEKDGTLRVTASTRGDHAIDMAMYRAAELARDRGHAFVEFLGGHGSRSSVDHSATVWVRPSHAATPPTACRSKKRGSCYTADVAEVLRILGGPNGTQPGVPVTAYHDEYGRAVSISGFGVGAASASRPKPIPPAPRVAPPPDVPPSFARPATARPATSAAERQARALEAAEPVRGREPKQGWTISD